MCVIKCWCNFINFYFMNFLPLKAFTCRFLQSLWIFKACLLFYLLCTERFPLILKSNKIYCLISYLKFIFLVKVVKYLSEQTFYFDKCWQLKKRLNWNAGLKLHYVVFQFLSMPYNILFVLLHKNYNKKRIIWIKFSRIIQI